MKKTDENGTATVKNRKKAAVGKINWETIVKQKQLIFMSFPLVIYIMIFAYLPLWGWTMAFQDFRPGKAFAEQAWVGFKHFQFLFTANVFTQVLRNTIGMSVIGLILGFSSAITLALLLNEIRNTGFKRLVQTTSYLPHFLSWVVAAGLISTALSSDGIINTVLLNLKIINKPILWLSEGKLFWGIYGVSVVWKDLGWNTIIYLAAITAIDPCLYEAAEIDGAGRFRKMLHITMPGISSTVIILLILSIGNILNTGFELQYLLRNGFISDWSDTIDVFVLEYGIKLRNYSLGTAAGIFKSAVSIILIFGLNWISKKFGREQLI